MNREVNLTKRVQTSKGLRYCPVVLSANGRVKPDWVKVNGNPRDTPKVPTTLSGVRVRNVYVYRLARMQRTPAPTQAQGSRTQRGEQWRGHRA